jgi:glutaredoxin
MTRKHIPLVWAALALTLAAPLAGAQQVFRIVGPDGRVTFSDTPPIDPNARSSVQATPGTGSGSQTLPFELRQTVSRFPVTLYSGPNCAPCEQGRGLLSVRGIPFSERTVQTFEDVEALQRLSGERTLPLLMVGGQLVRGFSSADWTQYLDAAGYPKASALPTGWRQAAATPLAPPAAAASARPASAAAANATAAAPIAAPPGGAPAESGRPAGQRTDNPAGIRF